MKVQGDFVKHPSAWVSIVLYCCLPEETQKANHYNQFQICEGEKGSI